MSDVELYREIVQLTELQGRVVIHKNGNGLDNRRENLAVVDAGAPEALKEQDLEVAACDICLPGGARGTLFMHDLIAYSEGMLG
jgi:hypothetical protein